MADIDIERKSGAGWLWLLLGVFVVALLGWFLLGDRSPDQRAGDVVLTEQPAAEVMEPTYGVDTAVSGSPVFQEYLSTCAQRAPDQMGLEHEYTADCIRSLVSSIEELLLRPALAGVDIQGELEAARQSADRLMETPQDAEHARMTREAFVSSAALLTRIQDQRFPALDGRAGELEQTAQGINESVPLLDQRTAVQDFFRQAGDLLQGMSAAG